MQKPCHIYFSNYYKHILLRIHSDVVKDCEFIVCVFLHPMHFRGLYVYSETTIPEMTVRFPSVFLFIDS